ncbi:MAG: nucleotidyltransferase domain-containing protein [Ilumatobacteraceae bacterium]|nr:nucleotidyltransferase domain-containing protein [Ilumatobacteraceae bacterium]
MSTLPAEAIDQMVSIIVNEVDPETVILFGSHARGDARPDSDVDLMVIEQAPFSAQRSRRAETARLSMALRDFPFAKDVLLYSREEFDYWKDSPNHVVGRAQREGKVLHVRR